MVETILSDYSIRRPPVDVEMIARSRKIVIESRNLEDDFAGFLLRNGTQMIIGVNGRHSTTRQRFTIAHELGHAMLHEGRELHVDEGFRIDLRSRESSTGTNIEEIEANTFAASLLMPTRFLQRDLEAGHIDIEADQQVEALAKSYDVSRSAMSYRLLNLPARWLLA